ncbi:MAG: AAA family ATPase [Spirochaetia bacterium]|nr:AAA family ATPase [Spirochaetia bacterium]
MSDETAPRAAPASATSPSVVDRNLERLETLQGTDEGVFVLAVHAFVEGWIRDRFGYDSPDDGFKDLVQRFIDYCKRKFAGYVPGLDSMNALGHAHYDTNQVRHRFARLDRPYAEQATRHLEAFCKLANLGAPERIASIRRYLAAWDERRPLGALAEENRAIKELQAKQAGERAKLAAQVAELSQVMAAEDALRKQLAEKDARIAALAETADARKDKADALRRERTAAMDELRETKRRAERLEAAQQYIEVMRRMSSFTRTRADYERSIVRLTAEQRKVLENIRLDADFLVKGAAGTGKTLVLLKAIEKAKSGGQNDVLGFEELKGSVALLTYTRTLVKYDRYLAGLVDESVRGEAISTADAFLVERLRELDPGISVDFKLAESLASRFPAAGLSTKDLAAEVESFIWANDVSRDEYVTGGLERRGMKRPLMKEQRAEVWAVAESMLAEMERTGVHTRCAAALRLARELGSGGGGAVTRTDFIFVDEAQDLPAAVLKALKACSLKCMVLAGDSDQSIYQPGFSFKRAGLDISGRTRILRTNFRNTVPLHALAERYRKSSAGIDDENQPDAFRDGPEPELFMARDPEGMLAILENRVALFLNALGYAPENLCVIVPGDDELKAVAARLSAQGLGAADIRDTAFDFASADAVRLTTMHSAKGLDFPVVLVYLPSFHAVSGSLDAAAAERLGRNLIYVALTRAMDHLDVLVREGTTNPPVVDLVAAFEARDSDRAATESE